MSQAKRAGFNGGLVIDFPESSKAKKYYLVLIIGGQSNPILPKPMSSQDNSTVSYTERSTRSARGPRSGVKSVKDWIQGKKERRRRQGKETRPDSKYTGRKRSDRF
jgi:18S rRNA (guanine1575-N7)-methyltransferase